MQLFVQLTALGSSAMLLLALIPLWRHTVRAYARAFTWQSLVLAALTAVTAHFSGDRELYAVAALLVALKVVAIPLLLARMDRQFGSEIQPYLNATASVLVAAVLVLLAYVVAEPLLLVSRLPTRGDMPLALGLIFVSLLIIVSRKRALTQVIGFLMLENGIALLAVLGAYGIPLVVEIGVSLDALMGFLVMQIFVYQIHETFESLDVEQLSRLRD